MRTRTEEKKTEFRQLWIVRINAACRAEGLARRIHSWS